MTDQEQWTPGTLPSDAKLGTDDPDEEARQVEGQLQDPAADQQAALAEAVEQERDEGSSAAGA